MPLPRGFKAPERPSTQFLEGAQAIIATMPTVRLKSPCPFQKITPLTSLSWLLEMTVDSMLSSQWWASSFCRPEVGFNATFLCFLVMRLHSGVWDRIAGARATPR
jgi:hypothetical protein